YPPIRNSYALRLFSVLLRHDRCCPRASGGGKSAGSGRLELGEQRLRRLGGGDDSFALEELNGFFNDRHRFLRATSHPQDLRQVHQRVPVPEQVIALSPDRNRLARQRLGPRGVSAPSEELRAHGPPVRLLGATGTRLLADPDKPLRFVVPSLRVQRLRELRRVLS